MSHLVRRVAFFCLLSLGRAYYSIFRLVRVLLSTLCPLAETLGVRDAICRRS